MYEVALPDGTIVEVPDNVSHAEAHKRIVAAYPQFANKSRTVTESVTDIGAGIAGGLGSVLQAPGQIAKLIPGLYGIGSALEKPGKALEEYAQGFKSQGLQVREAMRSKAISEADKEGVLSGFIAAIKQTITDPALLSTFLAEQLPQLLGPNLAVKAAKLATAGKIAAAGEGIAGLEAQQVAIKAAQESAAKIGNRAAMGTGAVMQGAQTSSQTFDQAKQYLDQNKPDMPEQQKIDLALNAARISGALGTAASILSMNIPGAQAVERRLSGMPGVGRPLSALGESAGEIVEEGGGQMAQNYAMQALDPTQKLMEGVGSAAGLGAIGGAGFGAALGHAAPHPELMEGQQAGETARQSAERLQQEINDLQGLKAIQAQQDAETLRTGLGPAMTATMPQPGETPKRPPAQRPSSQEPAFNNLLATTPEEEAGPTGIASAVSTPERGIAAPSSTSGRAAVDSMMVPTDRALPAQVPTGYAPALGGILSVLPPRADRPAVDRLPDFNQVMVQEADPFVAPVGIGEALGGIKPNLPSRPVVDGTPTFNKLMAQDKALDRGIASAVQTAVRKHTASQAQGPATPILKQPEPTFVSGLNTIIKGGKGSPSQETAQGPASPIIPVVPPAAPEAGVQGIIKGGKGQAAGQQNTAPATPIMPRKPPESGVSGVIRAAAGQSSTVQGPLGQPLLPKIQEAGLASATKGGRGTPTKTTSPSNVNNLNVPEATDAAIQQEQAPEGNADVGTAGGKSVPVVGGQGVESTTARAGKPEGGGVGVPKPNAGGAAGRKAKQSPALKKSLAATATEPAPEVEDEAVDKQIALKKKQLQAIMLRIMSGMGLRDVGLKLVDNMDAEGEYANQLITLALNVDSPVRVLRHEAIHAMKAMGLFSPQQWETLRKEASTKWIKQFLGEGADSRFEQYQAMFKDQGLSDADANEAMIEEAIADAFGEFDLRGAPSGLMSAILQRMQNMFAAIKTAFGGTETAEQILQKAEKGKLQGKAAPVEGEAKPSLRAGDKRGKWYADATSQQQATLDKWEDERTADSTSNWEDLDVRPSREDIYDSASGFFNDYEKANGLFDIPLADIGPLTGYDNAKDKARIQNLADQIKESGEIEPVFVAVDPDGESYLMEGQHRSRALELLGYKSVPARVIVSMDEVEQPKASLREVPSQENAWKASVADKKKAAAYAEENGIEPYISEGRLDLPIKFSLKLKEKKGYGMSPLLGIPMNKDGTVTVYYHTTKPQVLNINSKKVIPSEGRNRIYLTNESSGARILGNRGTFDQELDGSTVLLHIPESLLQIDQEYPDGRKDFFVPLAQGDFFNRKMQAASIQAERTKAITDVFSYKEHEERIAAAVSEYQSLDKKGKEKRLKQARAILKKEHNVGTLMTENGKLEKTRMGGLMYEGQPIDSMGLGLAAAQQISDKLSTCPNAAICEGLCLGETSGGNLVYGGAAQEDVDDIAKSAFRAGPRMMQYLKTEALIIHPEDFAVVLQSEIDSLVKWDQKPTVRKKNAETGVSEQVEKDIYQSAVRLNVTSDFRGEMWRGVIENNPNVMFYDYTKVVGNRPIATNHHLTYSSTGFGQMVDGEKVFFETKSGKYNHNWAQIRNLLNSGKNSAMAFSSKSSLPEFLFDEETGVTYKVLDGDDYDARFLDESSPLKQDSPYGVIVGLRNKASTLKEKSATKETGSFFANYDPKTDGDTVTVPTQTQFGAPPYQAPGRSIPIAKASLRAGYDYDAALQTKWKRMDDFTQDYPALMERINKDAADGKEAAIVLRLIAATGFRVGNPLGESKGEPTFGATSLRPEHITVNGDTVMFDFRGKAGIQQQHVLQDAAIASDLASRLDGRDRLFKASDQVVRAYMEKLRGDKGYKIHDFRTWSATDAAQEAISQLATPTNKKQFQEAEKLVMEVAARKIGDLPATAKESYVNPKIFDAWREAAGLPARDAVQEFTGEAAEPEDRIPRSEGQPEEDAGTLPQEIKQSIRAPNTTEFKTWFGGSKVVDENGDPLVVYHGTFNDFNKFRSQRLGENTDNNASSESYVQTARVGFWFNTKPMAGSAAGYTVDMPVYLAIQNPKREISLDGLAQGLESTKGRTYRRRLIEQGYDGIVLRDEEFGGESYIAFYPEQIKSAIGNNGDYNRFNPDIRKSIRAPQTKEFKQWFGKSTIVDAEGNPKVMYHGTARDITSFRAKQANAIFITEEPTLAENYAYASSDWMAKNEADFFTPEEKAAARRQVIESLQDQNKSLPKSSRDFNKRVIAFLKTGNEDADGDVKDYAREALLDVYVGEVPSGANILPVFVKSENPFDYENPEHLAKIEPTFRANENGSLPRNAIQNGLWSVIESKGVQKAIRESGFDGFYVEEGGIKNLAVYNPEQIKSATGNQGTFDINNPDIRKSLRSTLPAALIQRVEQTTVAREDKGFISRILKAISPGDHTSIRTELLNRYNQLSVIDKMRIKKMGGAAAMADISAESAALLSDLSAGITASALGVHDKVGGAPVYVQSYYIVRNGQILPRRYKTRALAQAAAGPGGEVRSGGHTAVVNFNGDVKGPLAIFAPLAAVNDPMIYQLYQFWAAAKRGKRLTQEGREELLTPADQAHAQFLEKKYPMFVQVQKDFIKYNNKLVDYMVDTGVLSPERGKIYTEHADYLPFYRQIEGLPTAGPKIFAAISGVKPPKALKGSDARLDDFLETIVRNTQSAIQAGVKNVAAQRAVEAAKDVNLAVKIPQGDGMPTTVVVHENGVPTYYACGDVAFVNSMKSLGMSDIPFLSILSMPANLLRAAVTKEPTFMLANMLRDSMSAYVTSGVSMTPVIDAAKNFAMSMAGKSPEYDALRKAGILGGYEFSQGVETSGRKLGEKLKKANVKSTGFKRAGELAASPFTGVWQLLEKGSEASDASTRIEIYKRTLAETGNETEALFKSLEVMNFNRKGRAASVRILTAVVPFLNARMQGLDVLYRAAIQPSMPGQSATAREKELQHKFLVRGATMAALSCLYWALTHDDDEYKKQEQDTKDNYWLFPSMGIKIPIPFEIGVLFKVIPERIMAVSFGDDSFKDFRDSMTNQIVSTLHFNPIPQAVIPIVENITNHSFFTGRALVSQGMEGIEAGYQVGPNTLSIMADLGKATGISPIKLEAAVQGYTGQMGMYLVSAIDAMYEANSTVERPAKRFEQLPLIKRFAIDPEARGTVTSFYQLKDQVDAAVKTANMLERGDPDVYDKYIQANQNLLASKDYINALASDMKDLAKMKVMIRSSDDSAEVKKDALLEIQQLENDMTENIKELKREFTP